MSDQREAILSRLVAVCGAVSGINAVARNQLDVAGMLRPAVIVLDGTEHVTLAPPVDSRAPTVSHVQRMELLPRIVLAVRGDDGGEAGKLMTLYRNSILAAVLADATLLASVTPNGGIRYDGCEVAMPDAEAKEHRLDINVAFAYLFQACRPVSSSFTVTVSDSGSVKLSLAQFPAKLQAKLKLRIDVLTTELLAAVRAAEPRRTGRLQAETKRFVDTREDWVRGRVRVLGPGGRGHNVAAAALEYGAHRGFPVRAYRRGRVAVSAYRRRANITERRFLRGPAAAMRGKVLAELQQAISEAVAEANNA